MTSRVLFLMRHAKSSWSTGAPDHDRPLNARGRDDAQRTALAMRERGWMPEHVLCSSATRTRETLAWMEEAWGHDVPYDIRSDLYLAGHGDFLAAIRELPAALERVMIIAHNPGSEDTVLHLSGDEITMTTANVARLDAEGDWTTLTARPCQFRLTAVLQPRELDA